MPSLKLTKSAVDSARPGINDYELRDTIVPGFFCKITPAGRKVFMLSYRTPSGEVLRHRSGSRLAAGPSPLDRRPKRLGRDRDHLEAQPERPHAGIADPLRVDRQGVAEIKEMRPTERGGSPMPGVPAKIATFFPAALPAMLHH